MMEGYLQDDPGWNGKVVGLDGTTTGFLKDFDAFFADDPDILDMDRRKRIPRLLLLRIKDDDSSGLRPG